jgi:hypothetical protein
LTMIRSLSHEGLEWVDVEGPKKEEIENLAQRIGVHQLNVEDSIATKFLTGIDREHPCGCHRDYLKNEHLDARNLGS